MSDLVSRLSKLPTAVVCDALDSAGIAPRVISHDIRPMFSGCMVAGYVLPIHQVPVSRPPINPYRLLFQAFEDIQDRTVLVFGGDPHGSAGVWGELLSIAAQAAGATGAIIDGLTRDVRGITALGFPVFARGESPLDSKGRAEVFEYGETIECGGTTVHSGDIVLGDDAGVVLLPHDGLADIVTRGEAKLTDEQNVRGYLARGDSVRDVFDTYGIL